jgi:fatty-acyl-CoA synthase
VTSQPASPEFDIATLVEAVATRVPDRPAVVQGDLVLDFAGFVDRSRRLARYLSDRGLGCHRERGTLAGHQVAQDLLAQYLHNGPAYLEGLVGGYRARVAPFNVNYRYTAEELLYLLRDARPRAVQYHARFAPTLAEALEVYGPVDVLLQVGDGSGNPLLPGAVDYQRALASVPAQVGVRPSPDDLYLLYTGGTTGLPRGVLWRQADALVALLGQRDRRTGAEWGSVEEKLAAIPERAQRVMPLAPYMHGAAQWGALQALIEGNTVVIPEETERFDPAHVLDVIARQKVSVVTIVGDAFGRPLADELVARPRELPSLRLLMSGGAALNDVHKRRLTSAVPGLKITENVGSSETGVQGRLLGVGAGGSGRPRFVREAGAVVISEDMTEVLEPGHDGVGWLATRGRVPLGYLGDPEKTGRTFPVVAGDRVSVPGDRARLLDGDLVELLGRDATTINSGGEKVFTEEVEAAVKAHPDVADAVVCGRPSERWGSEVVALVQPRPGAGIDGPSIVEFCARLLARYKLPKVVIFVDAVPRSASGKADYAWARAQADAGS